MSEFIILGAGKPFSGTQPAVLKSTSANSPVLDWLLQSVKPLNPKTQLVGGYYIEDIQARFPNLHCIFNRDWESTGPVGSLLSLDLEIETDCYVSYSDIVYREDVVKALSATNSDVVVAVDTEWKSRYGGRTVDDLENSEKVNFARGEVTHLGKLIQTTLADAEFVGLVKFSPKAIAFVNDIVRADELGAKKWNLSELVEFLRIRGFKVGGVDVAGKWAELNYPQDLAHFVLGTKAQTLSRLQKLVKKSQIEEQVSFTVKEWETNENDVLQRISKELSCDNVVVRSSALSEDGFGSANAGAYTSVLNVSVRSIKSLKNAVLDVIGSYLDNNSLNQVLVQPMVENVVASGVAFTKTLAHGAPYYVINYDDISKSTESITSGASKDHKTLLVYKNNTNKDAQVPENIQGLIPCIKEIEGLLDLYSLDIEFAICARGIVHILQVRPIAVEHDLEQDFDERIDQILTDALRKYRQASKSTPFIKGSKAIFGVMPDWNPAEIIGINPNTLALSLYRFLILNDIWALQRAQYGYKNIRPKPLLLTFAGKPYIDVRASFNSFVPENIEDSLTERLIDFYTNWLVKNPHLHDKVEFDVLPTCHSLDFSKWKARLTDNGFSKSDIEKLEDALKIVTKKGINRTQQDLDDLNEIELTFEKIINSELSEIDKAIHLLCVCRDIATINFAHLARSAFVAVTLLRSGSAVNIITESDVENYLNSIRTVTHMFTSDAYDTSVGEMNWGDLVSKYGHLRPGTYEICSPSYKVDPIGYLKPIVDQAQEETSEHKLKPDCLERLGAFKLELVHQNLFESPEDVDNFIKGAIEGRELSKFIFTKYLSASLDLFAEFGLANGLSLDELSHLDVDDLIPYSYLGDYVENSSFSALKSKAIEAKKKKKYTEAIELPPLIIGEDDFTSFMYPNSQANFVGRDKIVADLVVLGPQGNSNEDHDVKGKVVLIPQADPGYDWLFGQGISGLITTYGGANSHMAIRSAEFGLPAAIGVGESKYSELEVANIVEIDPKNRVVKVVQ